MKDPLEERYPWEDAYIDNVCMQDVLPVIGALAKACSLKLQKRCFYSETEFRFVGDEELISNDT